MSEEFWTPGQTLAGAAILAMGIYAVSRIVGYLRWRYGNSKNKSDNDDNDKLGFC